MPFFARAASKELIWTACWGAVDLVASFDKEEGIRFEVTRSFELTAIALLLVQQQ